LRFEQWINHISVSRTLGVEAGRPPGPPRPDNPRPPAELTRPRPRPRPRPPRPLLRPTSPSTGWTETASAPLRAASISNI
jgi:hypothetical protein